MLYIIQRHPSFFFLLHFLELLLGAFVLVIPLGAHDSIAAVAYPIQAVRTAILSGLIDFDLVSAINGWAPAVCERIMPADPVVMGIDQLPQRFREIPV